MAQLLWHFLKEQMAFLVRIYIVDEEGEDKCILVLQPRNKVWELQRRIAEAIGVPPLRQKLIHREHIAKKGEVELDPSLFIQDALHDPEGHEVDQAVVTLLVDESSTFVLTGSVDRTAILWSADTGQMIRQYKGHLNCVNTAVFSREGSLVLTASDDHTARLWSTLTADHLGTYKGHKWAVNSAIFAPRREDGPGKIKPEEILTASQDGTVKIFGMRSEECYMTFEGHTGPVNSAVYNADATFILTASHDATAKLWCVETRQFTCTFAGHKDIVFGAVYSADYTKVLTASCDRTAALWSAATGECLRIFQNHRGCVLDAIFSPDETSVMTVCEDHKTCRIHNVETGECVIPFKGDGSFAQSAMYGVDGRTVLFAHNNRTAQLWNLETGERVKTLRGHGGSLVTAMFSPFEVYVPETGLPMFRVGNLMEAKFAGKGRWERAIILAIEGDDENVKVEWERCIVLASDAIKVELEPVNLAPADDKIETAGDEDAEHADGEASPSDAEAKLAEADAKPLDAEAQPVDADATPAMADTRPLDDEAKPADVEDAEAKPAEGDVKETADEAQAEVKPEDEEAEPSELGFEVGDIVDAKFRPNSETYYRAVVVAVNPAGTLRVRWDYDTVPCLETRQALSIGNPVIDGGKMDADTDMQFVDTGLSFPEAGRINSIKFFVAQANQAGFKFQVYRNVAGKIFNKMSETPEIHSPIAGISTVYYLETPLTFEKGDCLGWEHVKQGTLSFTPGGDSQVRWRDGIQENPDDVELDKIQPRTYSYEVRWEKITEGDEEPETADASPEEGETADASPEQGSTGPADGSAA